MKEAIHRLFLIILLIYFLLIAPLAGCTGDTEPNTSSGAVVYRLGWNGPPATASQRSRAASVTGNVCEDYHIEWIHAKAVNQEGITQASDKWPCQQRKGELNGIPAGTYNFSIEGEVGGEITWRGEATDLHVPKNGQADAGVIAMNHLKDHDPPVVIETEPKDGTMDVATTTIVQFQFSEPVDPQTISMESVRLEHYGAPIQYDIQYDDELSMVTLRPVDGLPLGTTVTVTVTTDILDAEGNPMAEDDSWAFVTQFPPWHTEYLGADHADLATRIALETNDTVHIELRREMGGRSMSCERISANNWNISAPSFSAEIGKYFDKAFDAQDTRFDVRVLTVTNLFEVLIAFSNGGGMGRFPIELHDPMTNLKGISIATNDGQGDLKFSICFYDAHDAQLKYYGGYFNENIESSNETVDTSSGEHCDIAMSLNDVPHLSYHDPANRHLRYATRSPDGVWSKEAIDEDTATGPHTAIAVDLAGRPHICYRDESNASLKYAYQLPSGDWLVETVDSSVSIGDTLDIALDSFDQAHISYRDSDNRALKYAVKTGTGLWYTQLVDTEDSNGFGSAIAVDSQDYVHISYCHQIPVHIGNNVRYATNRPQN